MVKKGQNCLKWLAFTPMGSDETSFFRDYHKAIYDNFTLVKRHSYFFYRKKFGDVDLVLRAVAIRGFVAVA